MSVLVCLVFLNLGTKSESLRQQLQEAEDGLVGARQELIKAHRELQDVAEDRDRQRKETLDMRRLLGDEAREKESIQASNQELRALVKRAESNNSRFGSVGPPLLFSLAVSKRHPVCSSRETVFSNIFYSVILLNKIFLLLIKIFTVT